MFIWLIPSWLCCVIWELKQYVLRFLRVFKSSLYLLISFCFCLTTFCCYGWMILCHSDCVVVLGNLFCFGIYVLACLGCFGLKILFLGWCSVLVYGFTSLHSWRVESSSFLSLVAVSLALFWCLLQIFVLEIRKHTKQKSNNKTTAFSIKWHGCSYWLNIGFSKVGWPKKCLFLRFGRGAGMVFGHTLLGQTWHLKEWETW